MNRLTAEKPTTVLIPTSLQPGGHVGASTGNRLKRFRPDFEFRDNWLEPGVNKIKL